MPNRGRGLAPGDLVEYESRVFTYESGTGNVLGLRARDDDSLWIVQWNAIAHVHGLKVVEHAAEDEDPETCAPPSGRVLDVPALLQTVPKAELKRAQEKERDIAYIEDETIKNPRTKGGRTKVIADKWQVSTAAVDKWRARYRKNSDGGLWGLIDHRTTVERESPVDPRVRDLIIKYYNVASDESTGTAKRFATHLRKRVKALPGPAIELPEPRVLQRQVAEVLQGTNAFSDATTRQTNAEERDDKVYASIQATRAGERVLLDTNSFDVRAFDPDTGEDYALNLTLALDLATRSILAWRFTAESHGAIDVVMVLADMMTPHPMRPEWDEDLRLIRLGSFAEQFPLTDERFRRAAAVPVIYPETLVHDRGKPYIGHNLRFAAADFGINLESARPLHPRDKSQIERLFRRINEQFSEHLAGYRGRNTANRGKYVSEDAQYTLEQIEDMFALYVVKSYQTREHNGLRPLATRELLSPNKAYERAVRIYSRLPVPKDPNLRARMYPIKWCRIGKHGVQVNNYRYDAAGLKPFVGVSSTYVKRNGKWPIRYDPRDPTRAWFFHPYTSEMHELEGTSNVRRTPAFYGDSIDLLRSGGFSQTPEERKRSDEVLEELQSRFDSGDVSTAPSRRHLIRLREQRAAARKEQKAFRAVKPPPTYITDVGGAEEVFEFGDLAPFDVD